jgi:hypothetical protein
MLRKLRYAFMLALSAVILALNWLAERCKGDLQ